MNMRYPIFIMLLILGFNSLFAQEVKRDEADLRRRTFIEDFLQTYQTAYELKNINYISQFFSTNALIITETKELVKYGIEMVPRSNKKRPYKLIVEDKLTYIKRLNEIFDQNLKIKLSMSDIRIMRHSTYPEIYGVAFMQMWMQQNGGNNLESQMPGFIFFIVDFKKSEMKPIIHVRTWQPKDNIKSEKDKFTLYDFTILDF